MDHTLRAEEGVVSSANCQAERIEAQRVSKGGTYKLPVNGLDVGSLLAWSGRFSEWSSHKMMWIVAVTR